MKTTLQLLFAGFGLLLAVAIVNAQNYTIDWHKIGGGGGTSTNGQYSLSGTIGQHDAGGPMTGPGFSLSGGFWTFVAVQTPGAPVLSIKLADANTVMVYWPSPSVGFNLQVNTNLGSAIWAVPSQTVNDDGTNRYIVVTAPAGNAYYRLKSP